jgi:hypothetical protein
VTAEGSLTRAALVALVVGAGLMVAFDHPLTLGLGVASVIAFIVLGAFALLTPDRLAEEPEDRRSPPEAVGAPPHEE